MPTGRKTPTQKKLNSNIGDYIPRLYGDKIMINHSYPCTCIICQKLFDCLPLTDTKSACIVTVLYGLYIYVKKTNLPSHWTIFNLSTPSYPTPVHIVVFHGYEYTGLF